MEPIIASPRDAPLAAAAAANGTPSIAPECTNASSSTSAPLPPADGLCQVCAVVPYQFHHFGAFVCNRCRAFFRRSVRRGRKGPAVTDCLTTGDPYADGFTPVCDITLFRGACQACRFATCIAAGMRPDSVLTDAARVRKYSKKRQLRQQALLEMEVAKGGSGSGGGTKAEELPSEAAVTAVAQVCLGKHKKCKKTKKTKAREGGRMPARIALDMSNNITTVKTGGKMKAKLQQKKQLLQQKHLQLQQKRQQRQQQQRLQREQLLQSQQQVLLRPQLPISAVWVGQGFSPYLRVGADGMLEQVSHRQPHLQEWQAQEQQRLRQLGKRQQLQQSSQQQQLQQQQSFRQQQQVKVKLSQEPPLVYYDYAVADPPWKTEQPNGDSCPGYGGGHQTYLNQPTSDASSSTTTPFTLAGRDPYYEFAVADPPWKTQEQQDYLPGYGPVEVRQQDRLVGGQPCSGMEGSAGTPAEYHSLDQAQLEREQPREEEVVADEGAQKDPLAVEQMGMHGDLSSLFF